MLLMLPTDLAAALRRELDSFDGFWVGWEAIADGTLLALLHQGPRALLCPRCPCATRI